MLDILRKIVGVLLVLLSIIAIVGLCISGDLVFGPVIDAFKSFTWQGAGHAINELFVSFGLPLIMLVLGLIAWSFDDHR
jgi:hypothetical protein